MLTSLILFAQEKIEKVTDNLPDKGPETPFYQTMPFMLMVLMAAFFFIVVLPGQRRRAKEQEQLMSGMKKNDEVVTASGIIGIVYNIKEGGDEVVLKIDDNARIRVLKSSIVRIIKKDEPAAAPTTATTPGTNAKPNA